MSKRSIIYIDGFNLFYGALKSGPHKWLNLQRYFTLLRKDDDLQRILYFTALVDGPGRTDQQTYLHALETLPLVDVVLGRFKTKQLTCRVRDCKHAGSRIFGSAEEKRTDVNIALTILDDAYRDRCDVFIVVTGDSDLVPAIHLVKQRFPAKQVIVYVPSRSSKRGAAVEIRSAADRNRTLPLNLLPHSQFSNSIPDGAGGLLTKPTSW